MGEELSLGEDITLTDVSGAIVEVAEEIVPPTILEKLKDFFATSYGHVAGRILLVMVILLIAFIVTKIINHTFSSAARRLREAKNPNAAVVAFLRYAALLVVDIITFVSVVASIPALRTILGSLLTAGGALAIIAGIAAQDALGSVASGIMILVFKPFIIGDIVNISAMGVTGTVEDITLRHTVIKTLESKRVIIPNNTMNGAVVENFDYMEKLVCLMMDVSITYESDMEKAMALLEEEAGKHPGYQDVRTPAQKAAGDPRVVVRVQELGDSAVILRVWLWGADNAAAYRMKCDLNRAVKKRFDEEGVSFAYPHMEIVTGKSHGEYSR